MLAWGCETNKVCASLEKINTRAMKKKGNREPRQMLTKALEKNGGRKGKETGSSRSNNGRNITRWRDGERKTTRLQQIKKKGDVQGDWRKKRKKP